MKPLFLFLFIGLLVCVVTTVPVYSESRQTQHQASVTSSITLPSVDSVVSIPNSFSTDPIHIFRDWLLNQILDWIEEHQGS